MTQHSGILPDHALKQLIRQSVIHLERAADADQVQPASLDLRLGETAYRLRASFLPGSGSTVAERLHPPLIMHEVDLRDGAVLEPHCIYLVPLLESLNLPHDIAGRANPKSSTGRIDVFTRVITEGGAGFDNIPAGYAGPLYVEVAPRTFPILARTGDRLVQLRLRGGATRPPVRTETVSIDLPMSGLAGYRAKRHAGLLDLGKVAGHAVADFWEPLNTPEGKLILDPGEFYILVSKESVSIPADQAAEMAPIDTDMGEFRVHYAGFFDPGFGAHGSASRAVLEVRGRDVPFLLEDGQDIAKLVFEDMASLPEAYYGGNTSHYQGQGLKLSKLFADGK